MSLVGFRYIQTNDPSTEPNFLGGGCQWLNYNGNPNNPSGTGELKERNLSNTAWVSLYYVNLTNGGLLPKTGGAMTGAITGTTGWASADNPNFPTSAKVAGQNVATVNYVNQQVNSFNDVISAKVTSAIASASLSVNVNYSVAKSSGYISPVCSKYSTYSAFTANLVGKVAPDGLFFDPLTLPSYPNNGVVAQQSECVWVTSMALTTTDRSTYNLSITDNTVTGPGNVAYKWYPAFGVSTSNALTYYSFYYTGYGNWNSLYLPPGIDFKPMGMNYIIIGVKSTQ